MYVYGNVAFDFTRKSTLDSCFNGVPGHSREKGKNTCSDKPSSGRSAAVVNEDKAKQADGLITADR